MGPEAPARRAPGPPAYCVNTKWAMEASQGRQRGGAAAASAAVLSSHAQIAQIMSLSTPPPERVRCTRTGREHR